MTTPMTFSEEFNTRPKMSPDGGADGTWQTRWFWGARHSDDVTDASYFADASVGFDPFSVDNGVLTIKAVPIGQTGVSGAPAHTTHATGMLDTDKFFSQQYGYFEIRAANMVGDGFLSAFWLIPSDHSWPPEIDISEVDGGEPRTVINTVHSNQTGSHKAVSDWTDAATSTTTGFHTYGVDWGPDQIVWYLDGVETFRTATPADAKKPMHLVISEHVGGAGSWHGDASNSASGDLKIDYVRVWGGGGGGPPEGAVGGPTAPATNPTPTPTPAPTPAPAPVPGKVLDGTERGDVLTGSAGNDGIYANGGSDRITGGAGNDVIYNGPGRDRDVFRRGDGDDTIGDFAPGADKLELRGFARSEVKWVQETHDGLSGTMVRAGADDTVWMPNAKLAASDVVFA